MDVPVNADVFCGAHLCGRSTYIVLNPSTREVSHIVVKPKASPHIERVVPLEMVIESTPQAIRLRCTPDERAGMQQFVETEFIRVEETNFMSGPYIMEPFVYPETDYAPVEHEQIPVHELAIHRGAHVEARDGRVGRVDEFLVDPTSEQITHLVMREGHLWGQKDVTIPVSAIDSIDEDIVYLKLDKRDIEALPTVPIRRSPETR
jgi:sporulation protein YlmC with PRC-barrel domain